MFNLLMRGTSIRDFGGLTDKDIFNIMVKKGANKKKKTKEFKGDFCYKTSRFLVYYDSRNRRLEFLSRAPIPEEHMNPFAIQSRMSASFSESEGGKYKVFAIFHYTTGLLEVQNPAQANEFYMWLQRY